MFKRFVLGTAGIVAAVGGPAALFTANDHLRGGNTVAQGAVQPSAPAESLSPVLTASSRAGDVAPSTQLPSLAAPGIYNEPLQTPTISMVEAFNMNVTPEWIASRWPRISNGLAQLNLHGYRVPLVTGTAMPDLAGSLTYYFNPMQRVQRITFQGTTGDPRNLIGLLAQRFHLSRRLTNDPGIIVYEAPHEKDDPVSWLRIRPAAIMQASDPYHRFDLELLLEQAPSS